MQPWVKDRSQPSLPDGSWGTPWCILPASYGCGRRTLFHFPIVSDGVVCGGLKPDFYEIPSVDSSFGSRCCSQEVDACDVFALRAGQIKASVVVEDAEEHGVRVFLNLLRRLLTPSK